MKRLKVNRLWTHEHGRAVEFLSLAENTGETTVLDRRERIVLLDRTGNILWDQKLSRGPLAARVTRDGESVFILTCDGRLMRVTRDAELEWEKWVDRQPVTLAIKSRGQAAVVVCQRGRLHIINSQGERARILHTPQPVAHARITSRAGTLYVASAHGWLARYDNRFNPMGETSLDTLVSGLQVTERGERIFLPAREAGFNVIDLADGQMTTFNPGFPVIKMGVDAKGDRVAAVSLNGHIAVMNTAGDVLWRTKTDHSWTLVEMSGKGDRFVAADGKGFVACYTVGERKAEKPAGHFDFLEV
ncbi:MAG: outer membrane protein assembly factor BamB family protein [Candidatus Nitrospinota bacterium M3_3B_026]